MGCDPCCGFTDWFGICIPFRNYWGRNPWAKPFYAVCLLLSSVCFFTTALLSAGPASDEWELEDWTDSVAENATGENLEDNTELQGFFCTNIGKDSFTFTVCFSSGGMKVQGHGIAALGDGAVKGAINGLIPPATWTIFAAAIRYTAYIVGSIALATVILEFVGSILLCACTGLQANLRYKFRTLKIWVMRILSIVSASLIVFIVILLILLKEFGIPGMTVSDVTPQWGLGVISAGWVTLQIPYVHALHDHWSDREKMAMLKLRDGDDEDLEGHGDAPFTDSDAGPGGGYWTEDDLEKDDKGGYLFWDDDDRPWRKSRKLKKKDDPEKEDYFD